MYAIHNGDKVGAFFVYIKEESIGDTYAILIMPSPNEALYVKIDEIVFDLKYKNIRFIERIPQAYYDVCKADFIYHAKKAGIHAHR